MAKTVKEAEEVEMVDFSEVADVIETSCDKYFRNNPTMWKQTSNGNGQCRYKRNTFVNGTEMAGPDAKWVVHKVVTQGDDVIAKSWEFSDVRPTEGDLLTDNAEILAAL